MQAHGSSISPYITQYWCSVLGFDTPVHQPIASDSTTFFQVKQADGTTFFTLDSTNGRVAIGPDIDSNARKFFVNTGGNAVGMEFTNTASSTTFDINSRRSSAQGQPIIRFQHGSTSWSFGALDGNTNIKQLVFSPSSSLSSPGLVLTRTGPVRMGLNEWLPETSIEITQTEPYITLHNSTHEDSDGGGEVRIIGKREDGAGTETAAGQIEISHDGSDPNDKLGKIEDAVNTGAGLVVARRLDSNGTQHTLFGRIHQTTRIDDGDSPYTVLVTDHIVYCDTDAGVITANLPAGVEGTNYKLINCGSSGNDLTIDPQAGENLYGAGAGVASTLADGEVININYNATEGWW